MARTIVSALIVVSLSGCASTEFLAAKSQCEPQAYSLYPVSIQQQVVNKSRMELRGSGTMNCQSTGTTHNWGWGTSTGNISTQCTEQQIPVMVPYQKVESFDANSVARESFINQCALRTCIETHGRVDRCKQGF